MLRGYGSSLHGHTTPIRIGVQHVMSKTSRLSLLERELAIRRGESTILSTMARGRKRKAAVRDDDRRQTYVSVKLRRVREFVEVEGV